MKVIGIGNAIIDVLCKVEENFLIENNLIKGSMKLIDENNLNNLLDKIKIEKVISGGSAANTIFGLAKLGNKVGFIGKVNNDEFGKKYEKGLIDENIDFIFSKKKENLATGTCLILITPDSERTMCTFLGIAGKINEKDINIDKIKNSEISFLEGYLWDKGEPKKAFDKVISNSNLSAMSLSDIFCVERHKDSFLNLIRNKLDIIFANEGEIMAIINAKKFDDVISFSKEINKLIVITRGEKGSVAINGTKITECSAEKNLKIIDLTGAGDLFAAGFLHSYMKKDSIKDCLLNATKLSSIIIQKYGARI
jgi:sugar/nucleoside kinase (ribokinase family)